MNRMRLSEIRLPALVFQFHSHFAIVIRRGLSRPKLESTWLIKRSKPTFLKYEAAFQERLAAYEIATESTGEVIDLAEKNLEDFRTAYEQGQASLIQVQRAQEQLLELRNASVDMLEAFHLAEARLRFVAGNYPEIQTSHAK